MAAPKTQVPETRSPPHGPSAAPALNRVKRCRCGGGRMENLPRSGMPPVTAEVALGEVSCYPGVFLTYITCISPLKID